jgi:DNA-binding LacI/PurR family transcriptional regulator
MPILRILSAPEQVAEYLRGAILSGHFGESMPGESGLSSELGLDAKIIAKALKQLEEEGLLENQGARRRRRIVADGSGPGGRCGPLRVALLGGAQGHRRSHFLGDLPYQLSAAGHQAFYAKYSTAELGKNLKRLERMVGETQADAWVVFAGSRELLEWFAEQPKPVISVWGRHHGLPIASAEPERSQAYAEIARELVTLGHRNIVLLARHGLRLPTPGPNEQAFLDELAEQGIPVSSYHLPEWGETVEGFQAQLQRMFRLTPPTALVMDDTSLFTAALQFLSQRGLTVPGDVSLVCTEHDQSLEWCIPTVSHIRWDRRLLNRRILRWARRLGEGKRDLKAYSRPAEFVRGETIGSAMKE